MQRYFAKVMNHQVVLDESDQYHLLKVMRARVGDEVEIVSEGRVYLSQIKCIRPLQIETLHVIKENNELKNDVVLIVSLLKGDKLDLVLQKATELGVEEIVLLQSERSIAKIRGLEKDYKLERYGRIVKEAAEQSKRTRIPLIYRVIKMHDLPEVEADIRLIAYEGAQGSSASFLKAIKKATAGQRIAILVGPEGGFSPEEVNEATEYGYEIVSLGRRILRAETASFYAMSVLASYLERK